MPAAQASGRWTGFYVPDVPTNMEPLTALQTSVGRQTNLVNFFIRDSDNFPWYRVRNVAAAGAVPMITLEMWSTTNAGLSAITGGSQDAHLGYLADSARQYGGTVWLRPFHEMNGNWYPWAGTAPGNSPAQLIAAWRHVHDIFVAHGATNVKFVWCVNADSVPDTSGNAIAKYYPGSAYVDSVAIDGYNYGTTRSWSKWRSFSSLFGDSYNAVTALTTKSVFIAETGCAEQGGNKAAWVSNMFSSINATYTRIRGVVWFNADKENDWRVESSNESLAAYQSAVADF